MGSDETNPFSFVFQLGEVDLKALLAKENTRNLAVLFLRSSSDLTSKLLGLLPSEKKLQCLADMGKLEKITQERLDSALESLKTQVSFLKFPREYNVDGAGVLAKVIRAMSPEEELSLLESLAQDNPEELDKIRTSILLFQDVTLVPSNILSSYLEGIEVDWLYRAYFRMSQSMINKILSCLPEKKAMILERDLQEVPSIPSVSEIAQIRRQMVIDLSVKLSDAGLTLDDLVNGNVVTMKSA
jgi:flagellar motor switch protein FliG